MSRALDKLERLWRPLTLPHLTRYVVGAQFFFYVMITAELINPVSMLFIPALALQGEIWRLITFPLVPPGGHPIFLFFAWYIFYIMGTALEEAWGHTRFNLFVVIGLLLTAAAAFLTPYQPASTIFLASGVFLAFAILNPDYELLLFFILPVKVKWLAGLTALLIVWAALVGDWSTRLQTLAALGNLAIFFGVDIARRGQTVKRQTTWKQKVAESGGPIVHRCTTCGITSETHPDMDFRYCPDCDGQHAYCTEHLYNHVHIKYDKSEASDAPDAEQRADAG
ncbi:MAG: hypothetical protein AAF772_08915 [Acidobacteriota bacterium]